MQFTTILTILSLSVSAMATSLPIAGDSLATRQNCCAAFDMGGKCVRSPASELTTPSPQSSGTLMLTFLPQFCEGGCADCNGDTEKRAVEARQDCCAAFKLGGKCVSLDCNGNSTSLSVNTC